MRPLLNMFDDISRLRFHNAKLQRKRISKRMRVDVFSAVTVWLGIKDGYKMDGIKYVNRKLRDDGRQEIDCNLISRPKL